MAVKLASAELSAQIASCPVQIIDGWCTFGMVGGLTDITFTTDIFTHGDPQVYSVPTVRLRFTPNVARALLEALNQQLNPPAPPKLEVN